MKKYTMTQITPLDVISGVETLKDTATIQKWLDFEEEKDVISSNTYLEWAQNGFDEGSDSGLSSCISHAKLAVRSMLDKLLIQNHLNKILGKNYPFKINTLKEIGILIPSVVHKLIIEPRNELEHKYAKPNLELAENALGVARLAVGGISDKFGNIIALNWAAIMNLKWGETPTEFPGWNNNEFPQSGNTTILFVDVFDETPKALLIDEVSQEIRFAYLDAFSNNEAITFSQVLRSIDQHGKGGRGNYRQMSSYGATIYRNLKTLAGI